MAPRRFTQDDYARDIEAVEDALRDGYVPPGRPGGASAIMEGARRRKSSETAFRSRLSRAHNHFGMEPDYSLYTPQFEEVEAPRRPPPARQRVRVRANTPADMLEGPSRKVLAIGDIHDRPGRTKEHLKWISRHVAETKPDTIVQIGDWLTLDSLSFHEAPGTRGYYERGSFVEDLDSAEEAVTAIHSEFSPGDIPCHFVKGNHEHRADRAEEQAPNLKDTLVLPIDQLFARYRWEIKPYGDWLFLDGVGFTHIPFNTMGKEYRGKMPENQIGNDATFSIVFGHTHKRKVAHFPKIGPNGNRVSIVNLGTALPWGEIEHYAGLSVTGWTYGIYELRIGAGQISGEHFIDMRELQERYGG